MKKTHKPLLTALCLIMAFALMAGCSAPAPAATTAAPATETPAATVAESAAATETPAATSAAPALEPTEVSWYVVNTPQPGTDKVLEAVNKMLAEKTNINTTLKLNVLDWGVYADRMSVALQAGEPMDLFYSASWINYFGVLAGNGSLTPLDDLLSQYGQDIYKYVPAKYFEALRVGGKIRGVPNYQGYPQVKGLDFRADLIDKYGFDYKSVKHMSDLEPYLQMIKDKEPGVTPFLPGTDGGILNFTDDAADGKFDYDSLGADTVYKISESKLMFGWDVPTPLYTQLHDWYNKGFIAKDAASRTVYGDEVKTGNYAVWCNASTVDGGEKSSADYGFKVYSIPFMTQGPITTGMVQVGETAVPVTSKQPDRAMMLLNAIWANQDIYNTMVYGVEGTHWNWNADKTYIEPVEGSDYGSPIGWQFGAASRKYPTKSETAEYLKWQESLNETVAPSPLLGFSFNSEPVKNEIAQITAIEQEVAPLLYSGTADPAKTIPEITDRIKKAGYDKVLAEMQKQLDAWKAANGK